MYLRILFKLRTDQSIPLSVSNLVIDYTNNLLKDQLLDNALSLLESLKSIDSISNTLDILFDIRKALSEIIFQICYQTKISSSSALKIFDLLYDYSQSYGQNKSDYLFIISYTLLCSTMAFIYLNPDRKIMDPSNPKNTIEEVIDIDFDTFESYVKKTWLFKDCGTILCFIYPLYIQRKMINLGYQFENKIDDYMTIAINNNFSKSILNILNNEIIQREKDSMKDLKYVFDEAICNFISTMASKIRDMRHNENDNDSDEESNFINFLDLISFMYSDEPSLTSKFWQQRDRLFPLIRIGLETDPSKLDRYLNMLSSLACGEESAYHTFSFLCEPTRRLINWDHFFAAFEMYCNDFIEEDRTTVSRGFYQQKVLSEKDAEMIASILNLIETISKYNAEARDSFIENREWNLIQSLFTLLTCPIGTKLKACILRVITQFSKDVSKKFLIWEWIERYQILPTYRESAESSNYGIHAELSTVESKEGRYHYTVAFIELLNVLLQDQQILTQGNLSLDLWPYIAFIMKQVFEKYDQRYYIDDKEKWKVAKTCLKFFLLNLKFLYEFSTEDINEILKTSLNKKTENYGDMEVEDSNINNYPPGLITTTISSLKLFNKFLYDSSLLRKVIQLVNKINDPELLNIGCTDFEYSLELSLSIVEYILIKQEEILKVDTPIQVEEQYFVSYYHDEVSHELRTSLDRLILPDRTTIISIVNYILFDSYNLNKLSISIVRLLSRSTEIAKNITSIFSTSELQLAIIGGYRDVLEKCISATTLDVKSNTEIVDREEVAIELIQLMIDCSSKPHPNLTQLLIGKKLKNRGGNYENIEKDKLIEFIISTLNFPQTRYTYPRFTSLAYRLIYYLLYYTPTQSKVSTLLRSEPDFFITQLSLLPDPSPQDVIEAFGLNTEKYDTSLYVDEMKSEFLEQKGWLLKSISLELHLSQRKRSYYTTIILDHLYSIVNIEPNETSFNYSSFVNQQGMKIRDLLNVLKIPFDEPKVSLTSSFFPNFNYKDAMESNEDELPMIDIKMLYYLLTQEKERFEAEHGSNIHSIDVEINRLLSSAVEWNKFYQLMNSLARYMNSWSHLLEITFHECTHLLTQDRDFIIYELINALFSTLELKESRFHVERSVTRCILLLTSKITVTEVFRAEQLLSIFKKILNIILKKSLPYEMKQDMYGAFINYVNIIKRLHTAFIEKKENFDILGVRSNESEFQKNRSNVLESQYYYLLQGTINALNSVSVKILHSIYSDSINNIPSLRSLAYTTLSCILSIDKSSVWIDSLKDNGLLMSIVNEIKKKDKDLVYSLLPETKVMNDIYVFESKMYLLITLARSKNNAKTLFDYGIIKTLSECQFIDERPDGPHDSQEMERYELLILPVLRLISSILIHLPKYKDVDEEVKEFIDNHFEVLIAILKDRDQEYSNLSQLNLVTYILYIMYERSRILDEKLSHKSNKFKKLLILLFKKYGQLYFDPRENDKLSQEKRFQILTLCRNLLSTFRLILSRKDYEKETQNPIPILSITKYLRNLISEYKSLKDELNNVIRDIKSMKHEYAEKKQEKFQSEYSKLFKHYSSKTSQLEINFTNIEVILYLIYKYLEIDNISESLDEELRLLEKIEPINNNKSPIISLLVRNIREAIKSKK